VVGICQSRRASQARVRCGRVSPGSRMRRQGIIWGLAELTGSAVGMVAVVGKKVGSVARVGRGREGSGHKHVADDNGGGDSEASARGSRAVAESVATQDLLTSQLRNLERDKDALVSRLEAARNETKEATVRADILEAWVASLESDLVAAGCDSEGSSSFGEADPSSPAEQPEGSGAKSDGNAVFDLEAARGEAAARRRQPAE